MSVATDKKNDIRTLKDLITKDKTKINKIFCENCGENLVFTFKNGDTLFHISLSKIHRKFKN